MKETPILFTPEHIRAIVDGKKWQTRRAVFSRGARRKDGANRGVWDENGFETITGHGEIVRHPWSEEWIASLLRCPYGEVGDRLWVREVWAAPTTILGAVNYIHLSEGKLLLYKASGAELDGLYKRWRAARYMPRWAARLVLEIKRVRVERLQDISDDDMRAEGARPYQEASLLWRETLKEDWINVWDSINGKKRPWASNPWVWAIGFEVVNEGH